MEPIKKALALLAERRDLEERLIMEVMRQIMQGRATAAQIGAFLMALRMKGETPEEITGAAKVMREKVIQIPLDLEPGEFTVDTCGTGGDRTGTFNVSTTVAFVVAGAGIKVAKHGNRSVSSRSGSADVLEVLGVDLSMPPERVARAIEEIGIGFLFAPGLHPAMKHAVGPRRELGIRTIFNVLGPLTNPAGSTIQLLGVYARELTPVLAQALGQLGARRAWVVHGEGGMDELSLLGESQVSEWDGERVIDFTVRPQDAGLEPCRPGDLAGGTPEENAEIMIEVLSGRKSPRRDMVLLNAGAALYISGAAESLREGAALAAEAIDSGKAMEKLDALKDFS